MRRGKRTAATPLRCQPLTPRRAIVHADVVAATAGTADFGQRAGAAAGEEAGGGRQVIWPSRIRRETKMTLGMTARARPRPPGTFAVAW
ncbi:hypothetical protein X777_00595 [Ooceraea biroi]|uniref:Uncharacterized protein n=1 Tax=Ooceraea biroi TaxID=2015173 RepID=A0A026X1T0_OOCBI|nr:hypothetical protein X777_00595 [Ooceraea biroi]